MGTGSIPYGMGFQPIGSLSGILGGADSADAVRGISLAGAPGSVEDSRAAKRAGRAECQTCKERKYQDGSDEMVSFKAAAHISPESAGAAVMAHEQEHVSNAYKKAALEGGKVLQASVRLHMGVCPECGRSYVSGGTTTTKIQYNEDSPYERNAKSLQAEAFTGNHVDQAV